MRVLGIMICILLILWTEGANASARSDVNRGNRLYRKGEYTDALERYSRARGDKPDSPHVLNNMGLALYKTLSHDQAKKMFSQAMANHGFTDKEKSIAAYNLGNTCYQQQDYREAISWYRQAIDLDAENLDARYNLQLANSKQQQQQQNKQTGSDNQKGSNQDKNKPGDKQNRKGNAQEGVGDQGSQQEDDPNAVSREEAEQLLDALAADEEQHPLRQQQKKTGVVHVKKDW